MERAAFDLIRGIEGSWWYRGRAHVVKRILRSAAQPFPHILDFGAGFGGMHALLSSFGQTVDGVEPDPEAGAEARRRGYRALYASLGETAETYDLAGLFDVLEHMPDEDEFLGRLRARLAPGGHLAITVPAYGWLWSRHDTANRHFRRYTAPGLVRVLERNGFEMRYAGYWNASLLVPAIAVRFLGGRSGESALGLPRFANAALFGVIRMESRLIPYLSLPFGTGVVALARRAC